MKESDLRHLYEKIQLLEDTIKSFIKMDIPIIKENSEFKLSRSVSSDELQNLKEWINKQEIKPFHKRRPNCFTKKADMLLDKSQLIEVITYKLLDVGNPIVIYSEDKIYSKDTLKAKIPHNFIIDGSTISNCDELHKQICEKSNFHNSFDLSNFNPPETLIVMIENYDTMHNNFIENNHMSEWQCHIRNAMENKEQLLFVLLSDSSNNEIHFLNSELVLRLSHFNN